MQRRHFIGLLAASAAGIARSRSASAQSGARSAYRAVAFDAFPILDPRPIAALAAKLFPDHAAELVNLWRTRQFEYQWLRTLSGRFADFWQTTQDALVYAARQLHVELTAAARDQLMGAYLELKPWPDVPGALRSLRDAGLRVAFLSNMTRQMLDRSITNGGLDGLFDCVLSSDGVRAHKPDPRAYAMGPEALGLRREQIVFAAFAGWDAAGAKTFGYPTFWVNRAHSAAEELGVAADAEGADLDALLKFALAGR